MSGAGPLAILSGVLAMTGLRFLVWNFPSATIFVGDTGSGFIGLILAGLALIAGWHQPELF
ncbi:hypothetical protein [Tamilnaduibacter salinus]